MLAEAAGAGSVEAQLLHGQQLLDGGRGRDALGWFGRAAAAGSPAAMNMVGRCLEQGWGVPRDAVAAARWFEAAAARGEPWGRYNLATLLALGDGVVQDPPRALDLFRQAAGSGHAKSMTMVGSFHEDGWVVPRDRALAAAWYARGADGGDFRGAFSHARLLAEAGRIAPARRRLRAVRAGGTAAFVAKARDWLGGHPSPAVRVLAAELS